MKAISTLFVNTMREFRELYRPNCECDYVTMTFSQEYFDVEDALCTVTAAE